MHSSLQTGGRKVEQGTPRSISHFSGTAAAQSPHLPAKSRHETASAPHCKLSKPSRARQACGTRAIARARSGPGQAELPFLTYKLRSQNTGVSQLIARLKRTARCFRICIRRKLMGPHTLPLLNSSGDWRTQTHHFRRYQHQREGPRLPMCIPGGPTSKDEEQDLAQTQLRQGRCHRTKGCALPHP